MKANPISLELVIALCGVSAAHAQDPLPSWNDTAPKKAVIETIVIAGFTKKQNR